MIITILLLLLLLLCIYFITCTIFNFFLKSKTQFFLIYFGNDFWLRYYWHSLIPLLSLAFTCDTPFTRIPISHPHPYPGWPTPCLPMTQIPAKKRKEENLILASCLFPLRMREEKSFPFDPSSYLCITVAPLGSNWGWVHWSWCLLVATAWLQERDHMIALLLSVYICAFVWHHLSVHDLTFVVIATFDVFSLCVCPRVRAYAWH